MAKLNRTTISRRTVERLEAEKDTVYWDSELLGFGVRVYPTGRKVYVVQTRADGKDGKRVTVGRHGVITAEEARRRAAHIVSRIKAGEDPIPEPPAAAEANGPTVPTNGMPARGAATLRAAAAVGIALVAVLAAPDMALATTDTTFGAPLDTVEDIVGGTGGQLAAALAVGAALVGSVLRFNAMQLMGAVGVGIAAGAGTGIVTGLVGTAIV
ncbi:MAG: DUF4102 domain-containing protein [Rhodospirillaceae bacterium]|nr:DUF4102 domain-containing protein [Rhodospirillaceae bacterium]MYB14181.1 DUF4102 domain-containing protein [Rhodospirillaceae bacterium]MYI48160.1 DUF4102 domain-containing protein [Rhodospirillaceae bacterium]